MIRKIVHNSDTEEEVGQQGKEDAVGTSTTEDSYEYLDNIDFLQHIDMSEYEQGIHSGQTEDEKAKDEIGVNVDYLGDMAYFDELDYFDQLNKSLEKELKELDNKISPSSVETKRRRVGKRSNIVMVTAGLGVLLFVGGVIVSAVGVHLSKTDVSYASTKYELKEEQGKGNKQVGNNKEEGMVTVTQSPSPTEAATLIPFVEVAKSKKEEASITKKTVSEQKIPERNEVVSVTPAPTATSKPEVKQTAPAKVKEPKDGDLEAFFADSVFIGNSLPNGLQVAGGPRSAHYLAATSLNVNDVFTRKFVKTSSGMKTALEGLEDLKCSKIYVMFGINEIGWPYPKVYEERYIKVIKKIQEIKPEATIYVQSLLPVSKRLTDSDNMYRQSNMKKFNEAMKDAAKKTNCIYVNVWDSVVDSDGYLPDDAAVDGMHMRREYNKRWVSYLYQNTK